MYPCTRCGKLFGSPVAVRMHLRRNHFDKELCDKCGTEIFSSGLQHHVSEEHSCCELLPTMYRPPPSVSSRVLRPKDQAEEESFWEKTGPRLARFVAPGTSTKCRLCHKLFGDVHSREQHERDIHRFTTQIKDALALRLTPWNMLDHLNPNDVTDYVNKELRSSQGGSPECYAAVNNLVDFLLEELPVKVSHVVRGGSYGKDNCLVGHSDLDMVMFVEGFPALGDTYRLSCYLSELLQEIKIQLQNSPLATRTLMSEVTQHSLRFQYKCCNNDHVHHVDLMPCHDWLGPGPTLVDKQEVYDITANCKNQLQIQLLNESLLQLQVDFVRRQPHIVRQLIRLVKHWRFTSFGPITSTNKFRRLPNSYTLELITIHAWEKQGKPVMFSLLRGLTAVLRILADYETLCVAWTENYSSKNPLLKRILTSPRPVVVDPANPLNNVCDFCNSWDEVAYVARTSLKKSLFRVIDVASGRW